MRRLPVAMVALPVATLLCALTGNAGCTAESVRAALAAQSRADQVQQAVFDRQHEGLRVLLFRDMQRRLAAAGAPPNAAQLTELEVVWNERDLLEFWALQFERARALRLVGVDAKLYADQSIVDLLLRQLALRLDRLEEGLAGAAGAAVFPVEPAQADSDEEPDDEG